MQNKCSNLVVRPELRVDRAAVGTANSPLIKSAVVLGTATGWAASLLITALCCAAHRAAAFCQRAANRLRQRRPFRSLDLEQLIRFESLALSMDCAQEG